MLKTIIGDISFKHGMCIVHPIASQHPPFPPNKCKNTDKYLMGVIYKQPVAVRA